MHTYAVGDIHGEYAKMQRALARIEEHGSVDGGTVVFLGDYVDRGPDSCKVVSRLIAGPPRGWRWIALKGNHEDMMIECLNGRAEMSWWRGNGGSATLASYPNYPNNDWKLLNEHAAWMAGLPVVHSDEHRVYVHAYVDERYALDNQPGESCLWLRYHPNNANKGYRDKHVVHGHTPQKAPLLLQKRTNLDTGACFGAEGYGKLTVGVFRDDLPFGPIDVWSFE